MNIKIKYEFIVNHYKNKHKLTYSSKLQKLVILLSSTVDISLLHSIGVLARCQQKHACYSALPVQCDFGECLSPTAICAWYSHKSGYS